MEKISVQACERFVENTVAQCVASAKPITANPDFDALSASIASQSNAIAAQANYLTLGSIIFAVIAIVAAVGWGWLVKQWAEKAARDAVNEWMNKNAPGEISDLVADLIPPQMDGDGGSALTQEAQEEGLGAEEA